MMHDAIKKKTTSYTTRLLSPRNLTLTLLLSAFIGAEAKPFLSESFETYSTNFWTPQGFAMDNGLGILTVAGTNLHQGTTLRFNAPLKMPTEEETFLSFSMEVIAMKELDGKEFNASARIFIAPEPLPSFLEPYGLPSALSVIIKKSKNNLYTLSLYQKDEGGKGYGLRLLETMPIPATELPFTFDLWFNASSYRVQFNKSIETSRGARSGYISFSEGWKNDLTLAMRVVNESEGIRSQLVIDNVIVQEKSIDSILELSFNKKLRKTSCRSQSFYTEQSHSAFFS